MHWPAAKWEPHVVETITAHIDLYPTFLDLCGIIPPPGPGIDGISLRPLLEGSIEGYPAPITPVPLAHRDGNSSYKNRKWAMLNAGIIELAAGKQNLVLEAKSMKREMIMDFKHLSLTQVK